MDDQRETEVKEVLPACLSRIYEPVLCMCLCVSPPRQHGQAPNQALLQPQHLRVGQTVSGAAQVADVPSHERRSRDARQEAQCAWERQLCKLRRDIWQHLTPPHTFTFTAPPPPPPLSFSSPSTTFSFQFLPSQFLDWQVHVDFTCLVDMRRICPLTATPPPPFLFWADNDLSPSFQTIRISFH